MGNTRNETLDTGTKLYLAMGSLARWPTDRALGCAPQCWAPELSARMLPDSNWSAPCHAGCKRVPKLLLPQPDSGRVAVDAEHEGN